MKFPRISWGIGPLALLAISVIFPDWEWVGVLRGESRVAAELSQAQAHGYYEALLTGPGERSQTIEGAGAKVIEKDEPAPPGWKPFAESGIVETVDTYVRWRMKPNLKTTWNGVRFTTNSLGYRTPEVVIPKPPEVYRIVVLGSSNTMGHGVHDEETYARRLEEWLNHPTVKAGRRVEVVNLAVSSDSPSQSLTRLLEDVPSLKPDWILKDATVLDSSLEELHLHSIVRRNVPIPFPHIREILETSGVSPSETQMEFSAKLRRMSEKLLDGSYAGLARGANALQVPMSLVLLPRTDSKIENPNVKRMVSRLADRHRLPLIDLSGSYKDVPLSEYRLSPWDKHPSVLGHHLIFEGLRDELIRAGGPPGLPISKEGARIHLR